MSLTLKAMLPLGIGHRYIRDGDMQKEKYKIVETDIIKTYGG